MEKQLSPEEKLEALWQGKLSPKDPEGNPLPFQSSEAEKAYKDRILRFKDAIEMKKLPDRVPVDSTRLSSGTAANGHSTSAANSFGDNIVRGSFHQRSTTAYNGRKR